MDVRMQRLPQRGVAPRWARPITRKLLTAARQITKREQLDLRTWNRRLAKAGDGMRVGADQHPRYTMKGTISSRYGLPVVQARPEWQPFQRYRLRKDRAKNQYRTAARYADEKLRESHYWVENITTGRGVRKPDILRTIIQIVNNTAKFPYFAGEPTRKGDHRQRYAAQYTVGKPSRNSRLGQITFDKPGPGELYAHNLRLPCDCGKCE